MDFPIQFQNHVGILYKWTDSTDSILPMHSKRGLWLNLAGVLESADWLPDAVTGRQYLFLNDSMIHDDAVTLCADYGAQLLNNCKAMCEKGMCIKIICILLTILLKLHQVAYMFWCN